MVTRGLSPAVLPMSVLYDLRSISVISLNWVGCMQHVFPGSSPAPTPIAPNATEAA